jgi:Ca2+-binding RTX toxin-like protein
LQIILRKLSEIFLEPKFRSYWNIVMQNAFPTGENHYSGRPALSAKHMLNLATAELGYGTSQEPVAGSGGSKRQFIASTDDVSTANWRTYNFEVSRHHSYVADSIRVHNTSVEYTSLDSEGFIVSAENSAGRHIEIQGKYTPSQLQHYGRVEFDDEGNVTKIATGTFGQAFGTYVRSLADLVGLDGEFGLQGSFRTTENGHLVDVHSKKASAYVAPSATRKSALIDPDSDKAPSEIREKENVQETLEAAGGEINDVVSPDVTPSEDSKEGPDQVASVVTNSDGSRSALNSEGRELWNDSSYVGTHETNTGGSRKTTRVDGGYVHEISPPSGSSVTYTESSDLYGLGPSADMPIVLDLDGDGVELTFGKRVNFDVDDDGFLETTAWAASDDGFLVIDLNSDGSRGSGDGKIDQSKELLWNLWSGTLFSTDLQALHILEQLADWGNGDGILNDGDVVWSELRIWQDRDQDGETDQGELRQLSDADIASINLLYDGVTASTDAEISAMFADTSNDVSVFGNTLHGLASYTKSDGTVVAGGVGDVSLVTSDLGTRFDRSTWLTEFETTQEYLNARQAAVNNAAYIDLATRRHEGEYGLLEYIASYEDLIDALGADAVAGAKHYREHGYSEGRLTKFNALDYIASHADLISAFGANEEAGARHYIEHGHTGTHSITFNGLAYIASHSDLMDSLGANGDLGANHYITQGHAQGRATTFDPLEYLAANPDLYPLVGGDLVEATLHYINTGRHEGRAPNGFDAAQYLANYADLRIMFGSDHKAAMKHYIQFGAAEERHDNPPLTAYQIQTLADNFQGFIPVESQQYLDMSSFSHRIGNNGSDSLTGSSGRNWLDGAEGDDHLTGSSGSDFMFGGSGQDTALGGAGSDIIAGGAGDDLIDGGAGRNVLFGGVGNDTFLGVRSQRDVEMWHNAIQESAINLHQGHVVAGDFNGDGLDDMFFTWAQSGQNRLFLAKQGGGFEQGTNPISGLAVNGHSGKVVTGDFNGDGFDDVIFTWSQSGTNRIGFGQAGGSMTLQDGVIDSGAINGHNGSTVSGDFNGDGYDDLLFTWASGFNRIFFGRSDGSFGWDTNRMQTGAINGDGLSVTVGDFNGDGHDDVIFISPSSGWNRVMFGTANGQFGISTGTIDAGEIAGASSDVVSGDFNGDGFGDLLFHWGDSGQNRFYFGNASKGFARDTNFLSTSSINNHTGNLVSGDFNGDGFVDEFFHWEETGQNRVFVSDSGVNTFDGGAGFDTVSYAAARSDIIVNLSAHSQNRGAAQGDTFNDIEAVEGGFGNDVITGQNASNRLDGRDGNDRLDGGADSDTLIGGAGNDTFVFRNETGADQDRIQDFAIGQDKLEFQGGLTFSDLTIVQNNGHTEITFADGDAILLLNIAGVTASDMIFT